MSNKENRLELIQFNKTTYKKINKIKKDGREEEKEREFIRNSFRKRSIYLYIIITIILFISILTKSNEGIIMQSKFSSITLKINKTGKIRFFGSLNLKPDIVNINGGNVTVSENGIFELSTLKNTIILTWYNDSLDNLDFLFESCSDVDEIDLSNFNTSNLKSMSGMFSGCFSLTSLNLSNLDTSKVYNMEYMFEDCLSLALLDLSIFETSVVESMKGMFDGCLSLVSLDLSSFNTSEVQNMEFMFSDCSSLESLDLSSFHSSKVENMSFMFSGCSSLISLNLSNSINHKVKDMEYMFSNCLSLTLLNLSSFIASNVVNMKYMFANCSSLKLLDLSNFDTSNADSLDYIFYNCSKLEYINLKMASISDKLYYNDTNSLSNIYSFTPYNLTVCSYDERWNNLLNRTTYIIQCINNYCYQDFSESFKNGNKCEICGPNYYQINNDTNFTNCTYYYYSMDSGTDIDISNTYNYSQEINGSRFSNYIEEFFNNGSDQNNLFIGNHSSINIETDSLINSSKSLDSNIINNTEIQVQAINITEFLINTSDNFNINNSKSITTEEEILPLSKFELIRKINESLISRINNTRIDNGNEEIYEIDNIILTFSTSLNQKKNYNTKRTSIDLGECENLLKNYYNISENSFLYIIKLDIFEEGMKIPKVEYEIYYPLNNSNLSKLNLSLCKDTKIEISIPVKINDNINIYNSSSDYYNNICSKAKSKYDTDINLKDRKNEFINNNMTLCEEDCELIDYDYNSEKAKCSCLVKIKIPFIEEIKFDKNKLLSRFIDVNAITNFHVMKCYKYVFNKSIIYNYGFYILNFIVFLFLLCLVIFLRISFNKLKIDITNIVFHLKLKNVQKNPLNLRQKLIQLDTIKIAKFNTLYSDYSMTSSLKSNNIKTEKEKSNTIIVETENSIPNNQILEYKDFELNDFKYKEALENDKRSFLQYYFGLLKINHLFMFSFLPNKDYNSRIIKIFLFFFFFAGHLVINAFFFNDETMHKIYIDEGAYNFVYQLPKIIYSSLISIIISVLIKFLALSQSDIIELKQEKMKRGLDNKYRKLILKLKIKFIIFYILTFILLLFYWYYISCFCGIYVNTQIHVIKDSIFSFITSLIYPFGICLITGIVRIYSLRSEKSCLYKFSKLLQLF